MKLTRSRTGAAGTLTLGLTILSGLLVTSLSLMVLAVRRQHEQSVDIRLRAG